MSGDSVKVCVRVRPLLGYETTVKSAKIINYPAPNSLSIINGGPSTISSAAEPQTFTFDNVFDDYSRQLEVYDAVVAPLVKQFIEGYNSTILAYGQTGSGKTHSMGTAFTDSVPDDEIGIIPRVVKHVFQQIRERESTHVHVVKVSFLEVHNEDLNDLLFNLDGSKSAMPKPTPTIRDGPNNSVIVSNTEEIEVHSADEMLDLLMKGSNNRVTAATEMNARSSRSHAIFTIIFSQKRIEKTPASTIPTPAISPTGTLTAPIVIPAPTEFVESDDNFVSSRFSFVDLAGSEKMKRMLSASDQSFIGRAADGNVDPNDPRAKRALIVNQRVKEGININQGLLALGNVISALADDKRRGGHIPYRDSKITRILQDSLGGNSRTVMLACVSPADLNAEESLNTLKYANRAKQIKNKAVINRDPISAKMDAMRQKILQLESALAQVHAGNPAQANSSSGSLIPPTSAAAFEIPADSLLINRDEYQLLRDQSTASESEIKRLQQKMKDLKDQIHEANERIVRAETIRDTFKLKLERTNPGSVAAIESALETRFNDGEKLENSDKPVGGVEDADIDLIENNRRAINKLRRKVEKQKKALKTAKELLEKFGSSGPHAFMKQIAVAEENAAGMESPVRGGKQNEEDKNDGEEVDNSDDSADGQSDVESNGDDSEELDSSADEDSESLRVLADLKAREFEIQMKNLNAEQFHLTEDIQSKQNAMNSLKHQSEEILRVRKEFEHKIETMEKEMAALAVEREAALKDLESKAKAADYQDRVARIKTEYELKIKNLSEQLSSTRDKLKQNDKLKRQAKDDEMKIKKLESEILKAKQQKVSLAKQIESNTTRYKDWVEKKENKMQSLEKEAHKAQLMIKKMQAEFDKQSAILKRRNEEKAMLEKQIARTNEIKAKAKKLQPEKKTTNKSDERKAQRDLRKRKSPLKSRDAIINMSSPGNGNLSDSAAPASFDGSERQIVNAIEEYIGNVFQRSLAEKKLVELKNKREALAAERNSVEEKMLEPSAAEDPNVWNSLETQLFNIDAFAANLQSQIERQEELIKSFQPQNSGENVRAGDNKKRRNSIGGNDESGAAVDYRAFLSIKVPTLESSKRAMLYLMNAAVQYSAVNFELEEQLNLMKQTLEEERRAREEIEKRRNIAEKQKKRQTKLSAYQISALNVHYSLQPDNDDTGSPGANTGSTTVSPVKLIRAASHANISHSPTSPRQHSNSISGPSGALAGSGSQLFSDDFSDDGKSRKAPASIFDRLTDSSTFTGMYKNIAENKPKIKLDREKKGNNKPHSAGLAKSNSTSILPPANLTNSNSAAQTNAINNLAESVAALDSAVAKNVFSRLTDPKLYTGQAKQVFASRTNKPAAANSGLIFPQANAGPLSSIGMLSNFSTPSNSNPNSARNRSDRRSSETAAAFAEPSEHALNADDDEYAAAEAAHQAKKVQPSRKSGEFLARQRTQSASFDPELVLALAEQQLPSLAQQNVAHRQHLRSNSFSPELLTADEQSTSIDGGQFRLPSRDFDENEAAEEEDALQPMKQQTANGAPSFQHDDKENSHEFKQNIISADKLTDKDESDSESAIPPVSHPKSRPDSGKGKRAAAKPPKGANFRVRSNAGLDPTTFSR